MKKFIEQIVKNLELNGFPAKKVSLPTEKMFEIADTKGFSFNAVMDEMNSSMQILGVIEGDKIVFSKAVENMSGFDMSAFEGLSESEQMAKAQEMMSKMDPAQLQGMKDIFMNMSEEEKADIMKKGKDLGLV